MVISPNEAATHSPKESFGPAPLREKNLVRVPICTSAHLQTCMLNNTPPKESFGPCPSREGNLGRVLLNAEVGMWIAEVFLIHSAFGIPTSAFIHTIDC